MWTTETVDLNGPTVGPHRLGRAGSPDLHSKPKKSSQEVIKN